MPMTLEPAPRHYVLLTDTNNDSLLVSCADAGEATALASAAVWSDGGVSAWLWPEDCVRVNADMVRDLREGASIANLMETREGTANAITITEHAPKEPTDG